MTGSASDAELVERLGLETSRYEGPTGIVGVLHDACRTAGLPSASLWAAVPHYVSLAPSPRAAQALVDRLGGLLDVEIDTEELREAGEAYAEQVSAAVATDEETQAYVEELEQRTDEIPDEGQLPSGDALAAELTRFLRDRERDDGTPGPAPAQLLAEREGVARDAGREAELEQAGPEARAARAARRGGCRARRRSAPACRRAGPRTRPVPPSTRLTSFARKRRRRRAFRPATARSASTRQSAAVGHLVACELRRER